MNVIKKAFLAYIAYPSNWYVYVSAIGWTAWVIFMVGYIIYSTITATPPPKV
ncbi:MAG: hypothetical protein ABSE63_02655 [Thermoguttaceae bacterium]